jgi:hypothetical protein
MCKCACEDNKDRKDSDVPAGLKPFNLERALAGDPVVTRDGREVTQLIVFNIDYQMTYPVHGVCNKDIMQWTKEGKWTVSRREPTNTDLFMKPKKKTYWVNVYKYPNNGGVNVSGTYTNITDAIKSSSAGDYIKTISFDIEE